MFRYPLAEGLHRYSVDARRDLLVKYWLLWGPVQCLTFGVVPPQWRIPVGPRAPPPSSQLLPLAVAVRTSLLPRRPPILVLLCSPSPHTAPTPAGSSHRPSAHRACSQPAAAAVHCVRLLLLADHPLDHLLARRRAAAPRRRASCRGGGGGDRRGDGRTMSWGHDARCAWRGTRVEIVCMCVRAVARNLTRFRPIAPAAMRAGGTCHLASCNRRDQFRVDM